VPRLPPGAKSPAEAEILKELQRLVPEGSQMPSEAELLKQLQQFTEKMQSPP
jgi:hypothetical protein